MKNPRYPAVIFDLDGTLIDTLADIAGACNRALSEYGCDPIDNDRYKVLVGYGARNLVQTAVRISRPDWTNDQIEPIFQTYRQIYARDWNIKSMVYPGIETLLSRLQESGTKLAVLSNKPNDSTRIMIDHYFPSVHFEACYGQLDSYPAKPDPALALKIARDLELETEQVALIGDSGSDMTTAFNAGMIGIGVLWGNRDATELLDSGAVALAADTAELESLLLS